MVAPAGTLADDRSGAVDRVGQAAPEAARVLLLSGEIARSDQMLGAGSVVVQKAGNGIGARARPAVIVRRRLATGQVREAMVRRHEGGLELARTRVSAQVQRGGNVTGGVGFGRREQETTLGARARGQLDPTVVPRGEVTVRRIVTARLAKVMIVRFAAGFAIHGLTGDLVGATRVPSRAAIARIVIIRPAMTVLVIRHGRLRVGSRVRLEIDRSEMSADALPIRTDHGSGRPIAQVAIDRRVVRPDRISGPVAPGPTGRRTLDLEVQVRTATARRDVSMAPAVTGLIVDRARSETADRAETMIERPAGPRRQPGMTLVAPKLPRVLSDQRPGLKPSGPLVLRSHRDPRTVGTRGVQQNEPSRSLHGRCLAGRKKRLRRMTRRAKQPTNRPSNLPSSNEIGGRRCPIMLLPRLGRQSVAVGAVGLRRY